MSLFSKTGIPIGNLTSQIFANIYMNEFDQFVKHELKIKHYIRYTDDFVIVSADEKYLKEMIPRLQVFLHEKLRLKLHPNKIFIKKYHQGIDFLGHVIFLHYRLLRAKTKKRMIKNIQNKIFDFKHSIISEKNLQQTMQSYFGMLSHVNAYNLSKGIKNQFWY